MSDESNQSNKKKVLVLVGDKGGSSMYRIWQPLTTLQESSDKFDIVPVGGINPLELKDYNVIIAQRQYSAEIYQDIMITKEYKDIKVIYEIDDLLFNNQVHPDSPASKLYNDQNVQIMIRRFLALSDAVITTNQFLKNEIKNLGYTDNIHVCPNFLSETLFNEAVPFNWERPDNEFRIVWTGSSTHKADLEEMLGGVRDFLADHPDAKLIIMGMDLPEFLKIDSKQFEYHGFVSYNYFLRTLKSLKGHVAIAPVQNTPFNKAKSDLKFLEYSMLKIPTLASNVSTYSDTIKHGETGYLVDKFVDWKKMLNKVYDDWKNNKNQINEKIANNAYDYIIENRLIENNWQLWEKVIEETLKLPEKKSSVIQAELMEKKKKQKVQPMIMKR